MLLNNSSVKWMMATCISLLVVLGGVLHLKNMVLDVFSDYVVLESTTFEVDKGSRGRYYLLIPSAHFRGQINRDSYLHLLEHHGSVHVVYFPYSRVICQLTLMP